MPNKLIYSFLNPIQLFDPSPVEDDRYLSKDFIDYDLPDTILPWEQQAGYCQPWQLSDTIQIQLQTNVGPVNFTLYDCLTDLAIDTVQFTQGAQSVNEPGVYIYELSMPLNGYNPGCYYGKVTFGASPIIFTLQTGELDFKEVHENTLYLESSHYENREDIIFETGLLLAVRVHGTNKFLKTANKSTTYEDQSLNMSAIRNVAFRNWRLIIGGGRGIPDWLADKITRMAGCSDFSIDGKYFVKPQDSEIQEIEDEDYPLRGWTIELREKNNRGSRTYENNVPIDAAVSVMVNVDSKGFGNSNSGSLTAITEII